MDVKTQYPEYVYTTTGFQCKVDNTINDSVKLKLYTGYSQQRDKLIQLRWYGTPPCCDVLLIEINDKIKRNFYFFSAKLLPTRNNGGLDGSLRICKP